MKPPPPDALENSRPALRARLLKARELFAASPASAAAGAALASHLVEVLNALEPQVLGLYIPRRVEFNALPAIAGDAGLSKLPKALPFSQRAPIRMHYRAWDSAAPTAPDDCGIASSSGAPVVPDVVLVPCVGYTAAGHRLGYGGGYFDRWLAAHPHVTAVGVAWSLAEIDADTFDVQAHDVPLALIVTERGTA